MADRKTVENNIKKLYNDAVEYKMFKAATPSFSEFRHRMMGDGYQRLVFDNYKKAGIDSPNFKDINAFRGAYSLNHTDEAKQRAIDKAQGIVDLSKDRQRFVQLNTQKMLDKTKKPLKTKVDMSLPVKNPLKNDNLVKDPETGDLYTTEGEKFAATDRYLVGTPESEAVKAQNAIDIENLYKNFDESTANLSDAALHEIGYRPDVNGSYDALRDELYSMSPADAAKRVKEDVGKLKEQGLTDIDPDEAVKIFNQNRIEDEFLRKNYKDAYEDYMSGANHFASESAKGTWGQVQRQDMMEHLNKYKNEREAWRLYNERNRQQAILDRANANISEKLQQMDKERERFRREHPFLAFARDLGRASLDVRRGMNDETRNDFFYTMNERAAANKAEANIRDINESLNWLHGNQGKVGRAVRGAVRGLKNIDTYDFAGLSAASDAKAVYNAADRWSRGVATPQDDDLLAAVVVQNAIQDEHSDALGGMYGAGVGLAENARFIAAMFANPFNGIGKAAAKKAVQNIARWSLKKFGKGLTSKIATSIAKYGTRVGMDLVEAGVGAELFGQGKIMADYINRQTGDIKSDGHGGYVIEKPKETPSESLYKAHMSNAIEWASEMWGEYLPGIGDIGGWLGKTVGKGANKAFGYDKILNFFNKYPTEAWSKSFRQFQERTHWDGMIGEYAEEVMGNMANALTVGDMTWDSAPGTGVFNKKINTDTFLSVALMCGIMSGVNTAGYATYRYRAGKALDRADAAGQTVLGGKWGSIKDRIDNADERETRSILDEVKNNNDLNDTQKRIIYHYAMQLAYYHGTNLQDMKNKAEGRDNARQNAYGEGRAAQGEDKHEAQSELKAKTASLAQLLGVSEEELSNMSDEQLESLTGEDDDTDNAIYDYQMSRARMQGVEDEAKDNADNAAAEAETRVGQMTDKSTDTVRPAKMAEAQGEEDREVYIVSGDLETHEDGSIDKSNSSGMILYYDPQTGQIEHGDASMFTEVGEARPASEVMDEEANAARQRVLADNKAETDGIVRVGSTYHVLGEDGQTHEYRVLSQNEDGTVNVSVDGTQITSTIEQLQELRNQSDEARNQAQVNDDVRSDEEPVSPDEGNTSVEDKTTEETAPAEDNMPYESIVNQQTGRVVPVTVEDEDGAPRFSDAQGVFLYNGKEKGNANDRLGIIVVDRDGNTTKYIVKRKYVSTDGSMSLDDYKEYRSPVAPVEDNTTEETAPVDNNTETPAIDETQPTSDETQAPTATDEAQPATGTEPPAESVTLRDGTTVSMREDGNPAYEQMTPEQGADFYRDEFGEDARQVLEDEVKAAEDALNKAKETKVEGANFKEKKAAQEAKADAVKRVQLEYDTKKAFLDSFNDNKYETREEGRVVSDEERAELVNQNTVDDNVADIIMGKGVRKTLQKIADMMGVKLVFLQTADTNGWFDQKSNTIYVALDADKALSSVFGHEMTHEIKAHNDEAYQSLKDVCKKLIANAEGNFDNLVMMKRVSYAKQGVVLSVEDAEEEVVADAIGGTINNLDLAKSIAFRLSHPVLAHIQNVLTRILGKLGLTSPLYEKFRDVRDTIAQAYVDTMPKEEVEAEEEAQNNGNSFSLRLQSAIDETEREPSDAQKESGNYKKGHVKFGGYDFTIENPKGSYRSGRDADGKEWKQKMNDTYGYIRGTYGKDGDHLDMFINDKADLDNWNGNVYVVDQVNKDGSFDEHKVMYGFDSEEDAKKAYLSNYEKGWQGLGNITGVSKDAFDKWLDSSSRKTKPFAEYSGVKNEQAQSEETDLKPVGVGAFGNIYNQFRGKAKAAIKFLKKLGSGEAVAALHHHSIGDISLVWGDKKTGLAKILKKHPEVVGNLQSIIDKMDVVQESDNRIKLESPTHFAVISREYKGEPRENWLLTAYEKRDSLENGKSMDTATTSLGDDTALSQSKESSANISNSSETSKEKGEKFSLREDKQKQLDIINVTNPMLDDYHTGIRNVEDIKTFAEAMDEARKDAEKYEYDEWSSYPDEDNEMLQDALNSGVITIYSSKPIVNGNFVTPSRMQAEDYAGGRGNKVYEKTVPVTDVAWINVEEGQYAKVPFVNDTKSERIEKLRKSKPVEITGKEITPSDDLKQYKKNALEYGKTLRGMYTNEDTGETIALTGGNSRGGLREILQHDYKDVAHLQSIAAIPQIIEKSIYIDTLPNEDVKRYPGVKDFKYYVCGLNIGGTDYTVKAVIAEQNNGERYYDHRLTEIEKGKLLSILPTIQKAGMDDNLPNSFRKDKRLLSILQINSGESDKKFSLRQSYDDRLSDWKKRNGLAPDEKPMDKPVRGQNESIGDFMVRMADYAKNAALWKTAPRPSGYREALEQWKKDNGIPADEFRPAIPRKADYATDDEYQKARDQYKQEMDKWKGAPKASDYDLSVDLDNMAGKLTAVRSAMLNQRSFDRQTIDGITDMVKTMLALGWGDRMTRGKIGNMLVQLRRMNGNTANAKAVINDTMGILADNYIKNLEAAYKKMTSNKGVRKDDTGVIKIGSLDAEGQALVDEHNKVLAMSDADIATREGDLLDALANGTMNGTLANARLEGIRLAKLYRSTISTANADIDTLTQQIRTLSEKKNKTQAEREMLQSLKMALTSTKIDKARMYLDMLGEMGADVKQSKEGAKKFREKMRKHRNHILGLAEEDMEGMDATELSTDNWKKKFWNNPIVRTVMAPTTTFEQMLKFFGMHKNVNGEGRLYNYFMQKWHDAADEQQVYNEANRKALDDKVKELFGKYSFIDLVGKESKEFPGMDIEVYDLGNTTDPNNPNKRKVHLKQGQMLYIYLVNKEADGAMKLRAMGITEQDVDDIENRIHPKMKELGDWLQQEYLPECQRRYQETHMKYFGAPMAEVENYFPLVINPNARRQAMDVSDQNAGNTQLSGLTTGAIVTRRVNTTPLDIENADALAVAWSHLDEMEEWSAMLPFRQDINTLLSFKKFRNQVKNLSSMAYGNGEELWKNFVAVSQIAAGTYDAKTAGKEYDRIVQKAIGLVAMAKISGRLWTAFKQTLSAPAFLPDVGVIGLPQYLWNTVTFPMTFVWAKKNLPLFRKRIDSLTAGDPRIKATLDSFGKQKSKFLKFAQFGMMPNIGIDALTCAVGAKTVYDVWKSKLLRQGYPEARAEEKAALKASLAYNKSQQSSEGAFMSTMQVDRTYLAATMSLFKNSNYAYGRNIIEAARGLANSWQFWGKHRKAIIASMTAQIQAEEGFDEGTARKIATSAYNNAKWHNIGVLATYVAILPILWSLGGNMLYLLMGDDDDKKKHMLEEAAWKGTLTSLTDDYAIPFASNIINAGIYSDEEGVHFNFDSMKNQNLYVNPTKSDIANILNSMAYGNMKEAGYEGSLLLAQAFMGFNPATLGNIMQAFLERNVKDSNRNEVFLAEFLNAPESNIRDLHMDRLGLNSKDGNGNDVETVAEQYASRQVLRNQGLVGLYDLVTLKENGDAIKKYQDRFEKRIQEYIDNLDAKDPAKMKEVFDRSKDPKMREMIAKAEEKKAKAELGEEEKKPKAEKPEHEQVYDSLRTYDDMIDEVALKSKNKRLRDKYASMDDEYKKINSTNEFKATRFLNEHKDFKAYRQLMSDNSSTSKDINDLKKKMATSDADKRTEIMDKIRNLRNKYMEKQSKVR